ncbi:hypothetical protein Y032_0109g126 [Ancylostoma ceylanicum]|uniref:Uncharacterized protein n=1 Tax=Ancylostoma ceylanicum TaxID=53326 RepID=A0A016TF27_9BILA|nr:hypothetical protein Y032_0109g126 [Ancylostoma ceylanicum]
MDGLVGRGRAIEPSTVCVRSEPLTTAPHAIQRLYDPRTYPLEMKSRRKCKLVLLTVLRSEDDLPSSR